MDEQGWQEDLQRLIARMAAAGMAPDIDSMDLSEQRAVYRVLRRLIGQTERREALTN